MSQIKWSFQLLCDTAPGC